MVRPLLKLLMPMNGVYAKRPNAFDCLKFSVSFATLLLSTSILTPTIASAQVSGDILFSEAQTNPQAQMLLEADELVYDEANNSVAAVGNVQIAYDNHTLVATRVTYDRGTGRVIATGGVEIVEPNGNRVFADEIDVTDDFQDGFVSALRVETAENTRFSAESAERRDGEIAVFNHGVYTACEVCKEDPTKPPLWQIRANRVIINNRTKTVEYEGASFELFGKPIAYLANFSHADPSIKRKSGFLFTRPAYDDELGYSGGLTYFWALAPNYDVTASGRYYSNQGFLGFAEWRHRTELGEYSLAVAGIDQKNKSEFSSTTIDSAEDERGAIMSAGKFTLNPRWKFGWNALYQSDTNFARTYDLENYDSRELTNEVYLTGVNGKNHFDLRAQQFLIQDSGLNQINTDDSSTGVFEDLFPGNDFLQEQQATVIPSLDYNLLSDDPVAGGQVSLDINVASIKRHLSDIVNYDVGPGITDVDERFHGLAGSHTRASVEAEWKASSILNSGALVTTSLSARGDGIWQSTDDLNSETNPLMNNDSLYRGMPAAMLEIRYPMIASDGLASHIFEPIAQVIARPDETHIGKFANEDAQSFVFDTTNLFERDKFSGYDRVEGGTRANIGFRYSTSFQNGASINIAAGQSFHLHGQNSFAQRDLVNAGLDSGLETDRSDYVASLDLNTGAGLSFGLSGRFDEKSADIRRGEAGVRYIDETLAMTTSYIFTDNQPLYGFDQERHEIRSSGSLRLNKYLRVFGNASYDIENGALFSKGLGISYDDSCTSFSIAYSESDNSYTGGTSERSINFRLGLRTIGDTDYKHKLYNSEDE